MSEKPERHFSFHCSKCAKKLRVKEKAAGRRLKCPNCAHEILVPEPPGDETPAELKEVALEPESPEIRRLSLFDVDELVLEESPIENLQERQRQAKEIQSARAAEHRRRMVADEQRRVPQMKNVEAIQPHSRREAVQAKFQDAYIDLEPESENHSDSQTSSEKISNSEAPNSGLSDGSRVSDLSTERHLNNEKPSGTEKQAAADEARKTVFDDDLPELVTPQGVDAMNHSAFSASVEAEADLDKIVAALGKQAIELDLDHLAANIPQNANTPTGSIASQENFEEKYRISCPTCGTLQYVSPAQQGSHIKCPDCTSKITVSPPPANWKPSRVKMRHKHFDAQSPLTENDELVEVDRRRRQQTQAILDRAEVELSEEEEDGKLYGTDFDTSGFLKRTFSFALDLVTVGIIFGYSIVFAVIFAMLQFGLSTDGSAFGQGVMLFCTLTAPALAIVFGMPMISAALAQLEAAANQQKRVTDWPSMNIFDHFGDVMAVTVALLAASIPGYLLGTWLGASLEDTGRIQITGVMFTNYLLFPVFYLSILDSGSALQLVTRDVLRSIKEVSEAWGGYYLKTMIAFLTVLILWYILLGSGKSPILGAIAGAMLPGLVFFTFHQLGLLADSIGENLSPSQLPESNKQADDLEENIKST